MWEIYSIGSSDLLIQVLNGIAMLTDTGGPGDFGTLIGLGLAIAVLMITARAILTQRLEIQYVFVGWLLYMVLFLPKVTVAVTDIRDGSVTPVANVPVGLAAIGGITSTVGIKLTESFETVFSYPPITDRGYLDALNTLLAMRDPDTGPANRAGGDPSRANSTVDYRKSVRNYVKDCVIRDIEAGLADQEVTWEGLRQSTDLIADMKVSARSWFTVVHLTEDTPGGTTLSCNDAHTALTDYTDSFFWPAFNAYQSQKLDVADAQAAQQAALDTLLGVGKDAKAYMLNAVVRNAVEEGALVYHADANNTAGVILRTQAMEQRRVQWAAEQSLFLEMAQPFMAYLEAFFYAIGPIMAFIITLGPFGLSVFGKYLLFAVWVQTWMPVMAVNNLYISMAAAGALSREDAGNPIESIAGMDSLWSTAASYISAGGLLMGATPLLSLVVVTGSFFALVSFANRLRGEDHINEKIAAPDALAPAPVVGSGALLSQQATYSNDPVHGTSITGTPVQDTQLHFSKMGSQERAVAVSELESASETFRLAQSRVFGEGFRQDMSAYESRGRTDALSGQVSHRDQALYDYVKEITDGMSVSGSARHALASTIASNSGLNASANLNSSGQLVGWLGELATGASVAGSFRTDVAKRLEQSGQFSADESKQIVDRMAESVREGKALGTEMQEAIRHDAQHGVRSTYGQVAEDVNREQLERAYNRMHQAQARVDSAERYQETFQAAGTLSVSLLAAQIAGDENVAEWQEGNSAARRILNQSIQDGGYLPEADVMTRQEMYKREVQHGMYLSPADKERLGVASELQTLVNHGDHKALGQVLEVLGYGDRANPELGRDATTSIASHPGDFLPHKVEDVVEGSLAPPAMLDNQDVADTVKVEQDRITGITDNAEGDARTMHIDGREDVGRFREQAATKVEQKGETAMDTYRMEQQASSVYQNGLRTLDEGIHGFMGGIVEGILTPITSTMRAAGVGEEVLGTIDRHVQGIVTNGEFYSTGRPSVLGSEPASSNSGLSLGAEETLQRLGLSVEMNAFEAAKTLIEQAVPDPQERLEAVRQLDAVYKEALASPRDSSSDLLGSPEVFVRETLPLAQEAAERLGVNPSVLIAQAALETGWGSHVPTTNDGSNSYNMFGIKAHSSWQGEVATNVTQEIRNGSVRSESANFRAYGSYEQSFDDYAEFILGNPRYAGALAVAGDDRAYLQAIQDAGYATDPEYAAKVGYVLDEVEDFIERDQEVILRRD